MEFDWVMGCGLGWFVGAKFLLCDWLGWLGQSFVGLSWVGLGGRNWTHGQLCSYVRRFPSLAAVHNAVIPEYSTKYSITYSNSKLLDSDSTTSI